MERQPNPPALSWEREDIERRCSVPAGKFTGVNSLFACVVGTGLSAAFYAAILPFSGSWFTRMFTERSWVQYATVFLSGWSLAILAIKWAKLRLQARALSLRLVPDAGDFVLSPVTAPLLLHNIYAAVDDPRHFLLLNRIARSLGSLKNMGRVSDVDDVLRSQAENDENYLESTHTLVHGFVWAIPVLGFIGTVLGLSDAIGSFGSILTKGAEMSDLRAGLQSVTSGLSVAFETTLVALVAALCIQLLLTLLKKREMEFLDACGDYCHANIVSKVRIVNLESTPAGEGRTP